MMRPLRRTGATPDVLWEKSVVLARRSQTRGDEVREATKNATRFRVTLPTEVMAVLRWHAERLPSGPMRDTRVRPVVAAEASDGERAVSGDDRN